MRAHAAGVRAAALLARQPGRRSARKELIERVWGTASTPTRRRSRCTSGGSAQGRARSGAVGQIETVWGVGYRSAPWGRARRRGARRAVGRARAWATYDFHGAWLTFVLFVPAGAPRCWCAPRSRGAAPALRRQAVLIGAVRPPSRSPPFCCSCSRCSSPRTTRSSPCSPRLHRGARAVAGASSSRRVLGDVRAVAPTSGRRRGAPRRHVGRRGGGEVAELGQVEAMVDRLARPRRPRRAVAAVSHDLRTPITSLRLLAEAIEDDIVDGRPRRLLAQHATHVVRWAGSSRTCSSSRGWRRATAPLVDGAGALAELVAETVEAMARTPRPRGVVRRRAGPSAPRAAIRSTSSACSST